MESVTRSFGMTRFFVSLTEFRNPWFPFPLARRKEAREGSTEEISFPRNLRDSDGVDRGGAEGARL
jgi:hypothetical protein